MREKRPIIIRNLRGCLGGLCSLLFLCTPAGAQYYYPNNAYPDQYYYGPGGEYPDAPQTDQRTRQQQSAVPQANLQYDQRDAEMILREQVNRSRQYQNNNRAPEPQAQQQQMYDDYYGHRISDEGQLQQVLAEAKHIGGMIRTRNGRSFIVIDKRNFQFYLYNANAGLLRIGPVAIGKGKTGVGAFETPVGIFPIKQKVAVDDWVRPDWYFIEENEPIPQRWEDRRVPGFFRYKLVYEGSRYIHYAEATGGRLTHGCLGLDWQDAEAVFHTLQVGSHCIIIDQTFLGRLAKGEFPVQKSPAPATAATATKPERRPAVAEPAKEPPAVSPAFPVTETPARAPVASSIEPPRSSGVSAVEPAAGERVLRNLW